MLLTCVTLAFALDELHTDAIPDNSGVFLCVHTFARHKTDTNIHALHKYEKHDNWPLEICTLPSVLQFCTLAKPGLSLNTNKTHLGNP